MSEWRAVLNGVGIGSAVYGDLACLTLPPDGLGVPDLRTEDQTYPQRDGVEHFSDWYAARLVTLTALLGGECGCSGDTRANARTIENAWRRQCDDVEMVLWSDCPASDPVNMVPNPSFDENTAGWEFPGHLDSEFVRDTSVYHSAPASLKFTNALGPGDVGLTVTSSQFPVIGGHDIGGSVFIRAAGTPRRFQYGYSFFDSSGSDIGDYLVGAPVYDSASQWTEVSFYMTVPDAAVAATVTAILATPPTLGADEVHYFDDFSMRDLTVGDSINGPFGVVGRPRIATKTWRQGKSKIADMTLRFDSTDERLYILDADGTPGSGAVCATLDTQTNSTDLGYYSGAVVAADSEIRCLWPMDFLRTDAWDPDTADGVEVTHDIIGTDNTALMWGGFGSGPNFPPMVGPAIDYTIGLSSIVGPANLQTPAFASSYTQGLFGWWQVTPSGGLPCGAMMQFSNASIGQDASGQPSPEIRWAGTNVAMNAAVQDAFGFTGALRDEPVLIVLVWSASSLKIYGGYEGNLGGTKLLQTVTVGAKPSTGPAILLRTLGQTAAAMMGDGTSFDGEAITTSLANTALTDSLTAVTLPDAGDLCSPIQVTFDIDPSGTFEDIYIFREDGSYVGVLQDGPFAGNNATSLDTATGKALRFFGQEDATPQIVGDPFLQVSPGETLNIFAAGAGASVTVCYRPSVLSA